MNQSKLIYEILSKLQNELSIVNRVVVVLSDPGRGQVVSRHTKFVEVINPGRWIEVVSVKKHCFFCYG
jgi:hypothetical protein